MPAGMPPGSRLPSWRTRSVSCIPGWSELTVTPSPATSRASVLRKPVAPARAVFERISCGDRLPHRDRRDRHHPPPPLLAHVRHGGVAHRDHGETVQLERGEVLVDSRRREVPGRRSARVRHQDVDAAERVAGGVDEATRAVGRWRRPRRAEPRRGRCGSRRPRSRPRCGCTMATWTPSSASAAAVAKPSPRLAAATAARRPEMPRSIRRGWDRRRRAANGPCAPCARR